MPVREPGESLIDPDDRLNTLKTLLIVNKAYQEVIDDKISSLEKFLAKNLHQQASYFSRKKILLISS